MRAEMFRVFGDTASQITQDGKLRLEQFPVLRQALIDRGLWADTIRKVNTLVVIELDARGTPWPAKKDAPPTELLSNEFRAAARRTALQVGMTALLKAPEMGEAAEDGASLEKVLRFVFFGMIFGMGVGALISHKSLFSWRSAPPVFLAALVLVVWLGVRLVTPHPYPLWDADD